MKKRRGVTDYLAPFVLASALVLDPLRAEGRKYYPGFEDSINNQMQEEWEIATIKKFREIMIKEYKTGPIKLEINEKDDFNGEIRAYLKKSDIRLEAEYSSNSKVYVSIKSFDSNGNSLGTYAIEGDPKNPEKLAERAAAHVLYWISEYTNDFELKKAVEKYADRLEIPFRKETGLAAKTNTGGLNDQTTQQIKIESVSFKEMPNTKDLISRMFYGNRKPYRLYNQEQEKFQIKRVFDLEE